MVEIKKNADAVETRAVDETKAASNELVFYYSREKRLAKAPPEVRALYEKQPQRRFGMFRSLTDTKPKALLFTTIVVMCLMILFMTYLLPDGAKARIEGNTLAFSAMRYGGSSFVVIKKTAAGTSAYTGFVDITVYGQDGTTEPAPSAQKRIVWTEQKKEEFRFSVPFESPTLLVYMQAGPESASFTVKSE